MSRSVPFALALSCIMAASSASAATHVVDCTTALPTLSDAISVAANGDTIVVHTCPFPISDNVVISGFDDLHVIGVESGLATGVSANGPIASPAISAQFDCLGGICLRIENSQDVTISGLGFANAADGIQVLGCDSVILHDVVIDGAINDGILIAGGQRTTVIGSRVNNVGMHGINADVTDRPTLVDNWVTGAGAVGILIQNPSAGGPYANVLHNRVENGGGIGIASAGMFQARLDRNTSSGHP
ncbi:MAG: right-handed parallel beta-helix repeat-containing protein, partial [Myxococcota bacterium]